MNNALKTAVLSALLLTVTSGYAQTKQYPYVQNGKIIVCREGTNGVKSSLIHPNWTEMPAHNESDITNNRVAAKFDVAPSDAGTSLTWADALRRCQTRGAGWRLPTVRELRLLLALRDELTVKFSSSVISNRYYWSATEDSSTEGNSWCVDFGKEEGRVSSAATSTKYYVRCVRDL